MNKVGGKSPIRVVVVGSPDASEVLLGSTGSGDGVFQSLLTREYAGAFRLEAVHIPMGDVSDWLDHLNVGSFDVDALADCDLLVFSVASTVLGETVSTGGPTKVITESGRSRLTSSELFEDRLGELVVRLKTLTDAHILVFNASSLDPTQRVFDYSTVSETALERIRRANLALIHVSMGYGISIVDVDRVVAEMGGRDHLDGPLQYSEGVIDALAEELLVITRDIGFYEERPLLAQLGQKAASN